MDGVKIWHDELGDYLEVIFEDVPATMEEVAEDMFERRTTDGRIVGFSVFNFSQHDRSKLVLPLAVTATPT